MTTQGRVGVSRVMTVQATSSGSTGYAGAKITILTNSQSAGSGATVKVAYDHVEYDSSGFAIDEPSSFTAGKVFKIPTGKAGLYHIHAALGTSDDLTGLPALWDMYVGKNATYPGTGTTIAYAQITDMMNGNDADFQMVGSVVLAAGDILRMFMRQASANTQTIHNDPVANFFALTFIGS